MRLFVVALLSGDRVEVEVEPTATVADVKQSISARSGLPFDRQCLVFCGKELEDAHTIEQCGAAADSVLHLVEVKPAGYEGDNAGGVGGAAVGGGGNEGPALGQLFLDIEENIAAHNTQAVSEVRAQLEDVNFLQRFKCSPVADKVDEVAAALRAEAPADESTGREFGAPLELYEAKAMLDNSKQKLAKGQDVQNYAANMRAASAAERREEVQQVYDHAPDVDDKCQREIRRLEQLQLSLIANQNFHGADNAAWSADAYHALLRKEGSEAQEQEEHEARERQEREARERDERAAQEQEEREAREREAQEREPAAISMCALFDTHRRRAIIKSHV